LQQHRAQQFFGCDGWPTGVGLKANEIALHIGEGLVHQLPVCPKRMILSNPCFQINIAEQRSRSLIRSAQITLPQRGRVKHDGKGETSDLFNSLLGWPEGTIRPSPPNVGEGRMVPSVSRLRLN
jgi:hypothetical protein